MGIENEKERTSSMLDCKLAVQRGNPRKKGQLSYKFTREKERKTEEHKKIIFLFLFYLLGKS